MLPIFVIVFAVLVASTRSAPAPSPLLAPAPQYVILQPAPPPPAAAHSDALHYETIYKLQQPVFQQISPLGSVMTPQNQQLIVLYPNGPLTQYPLISLREEGGSGGGGGGESGGGTGGGTPSGGDIWVNLSNYFQNFFGQAGGSGGQPEAPPTVSSDQPKEEMIRAEAPLMPASTSELIPNKNRFYILGGQPQFFGKFDALGSSAPFLQPLLHQPLLNARGATSDIAPILAADESETAPAAFAPAAPQKLIQLPALVPLTAGTPLQLRSSFVQPLQRLEPDTPEGDDAANSKAIEPEGGGGGGDDDGARSLLMVAPEPTKPDDDATPSEMYVGRSQGFDGFRAAAEQPAAEGMDEDEQSIAHAKPSGIALAGRGGVASSKPLATALVGDGGLAVASPSATAISGDLSDEDDVDESKKIF